MSQLGPRHTRHNALLSRRFSSLALLGSVVTVVLAAVGGWLGGGWMGAVALGLFAFVFLCLTGLPAFWAFSGLGSASGAKRELHAARNTVGIRGRFRVVRAHLRLYLIRKRQRWNSEQ